MGNGKQPYTWNDIRKIAGGILVLITIALGMLGLPVGWILVLCVIAITLIFG
jgi:hypothetical protein